MLSKRAGLASQYSGQWRKKWFMDSMSPPQIQMKLMVSLQPCLNLCLLRWLKPRRNLVNSFIPYQKHHVVVTYLFSIILFFYAEEWVPFLKCCFVKSAIIFIIFSDFLLFNQIFFSPQVESCVIIICRTTYDFC